jgi:hypothetical protein
MIVPENYIYVSLITYVSEMINNVSAESVQNLGKPSNKTPKERISRGFK